MNSFLGYPQFMQNLNNPMQSGFYWSSFGNPMTSRMEAKKGINYSPKQQQNQLLTLQEELGNLYQQLGMNPTAGAFDPRQLIQGNFSQQLGVPSILPNARQVLQQICPGINPTMYCQQYCVKKRLVLELNLVYEKPHQFTFNMKVEQKGGPVLLTSGTDSSKSEAKQRAAEQMIPQLLQMYGPLEKPIRLPRHHPDRRSNGQRSKWAKLTDEEWVKQMTERDPSTSNATSMLFQWAQHKRLQVPTYETTWEELATAGNEYQETMNSIKHHEFSNSKESDATSNSTDLKQEEDLPSARRAKTDKLNLKPRMYTVTCNFGDKKFVGKDMDAKKAKMSASAAAWEECCPKYQD